MPPLGELRVDRRRVQEVEVVCLEEHALMRGREGEPEARLGVDAQRAVHWNEAVAEKSVEGVTPLATPAGGNGVAANTFGQRHRGTGIHPIAALAVGPVLVENVPEAQVCDPGRPVPTDASQRFRNSTRSAVR